MARTSFFSCRRISLLYGGGAKFVSSRQWDEATGKRKEAGNRREKQAGPGLSWRMPARLLALLCFFRGPWRASTGPSLDCHPQ